MQVQTYKQHARYVPVYHVILFSILLGCLIASAWNGVRAFQHLSGRLVAVSIFGLSVAGFITAWYARAFALKAQDRAIRAEENLRHFALTGKLLDKRIKMSQIIALRFADDSEFVKLADKAANENISANEIKQAISNWRPDYHRA